MNRRTEEVTVSAALIAVFLARVSNGFEDPIELVAGMAAWEAAKLPAEDASVAAD
jgi:hypothetical protein